MFLKALITTVILIGISCFNYYFALKNENQIIMSHFETVSGSILTDLVVKFEQLKLLSDLFTATLTIQNGSFSQGLLSFYANFSSEVQSVAYQFTYSKLVPYSQVASFSEQYRLNITEIVNSSYKLVSDAPPRPYYVPTILVWPNEKLLTGGLSIIGVDMLFNPIRAAAIQLSLQTAGAALTTTVQFYSVLLPNSTIAHLLCF